MRKQDMLRVDRFWSKSSEGELPAGNLASKGGAWGQPVPPVSVNFGRPGRPAARTAISLFVLLLLAVVMLAAPAISPAQLSVGVSVTFGPPALPIYAQPLCPGPGFIWIPGYWAWDPDFGYYWVPGMWVLAPFTGALWTPGYWGWSDGVYVWYEGYWGPVVGFYGGINYGFGYTGFGYDGGYWRDGAFYYNRTVNNINVTNITTVYSKTVSNVRPAGASFNGGSGGTTARPTSEQLAAAKQKRSSLTDSQKQQMQVARTDPKQRATVNKGRPTIAATTKPGVFKGSGVIKATRAGAPYKAPPSARKAEPGGPAPKGEKPEVKPQKRKLMAPEGGPAPKGEKPEVKPQKRKPMAPEGGPAPKGEKPEVKPQKRKLMAPEGGPAPKGEKPEVKPQKRKLMAPEGGPAPKGEKPEVKPQKRKPMAPEGGPAPKGGKGPAGPAEKKKPEKPER
jgi:hypothetical protein